jgi:hypothetical protein
MTALNFFQKRATELMKEWARNQRQPTGVVEQQMDRRGVCGWKKLEEVPKWGQQGDNWITE